MEEQTLSATGMIQMVRLAQEILKNESIMTCFNRMDSSLTNQPLDTDHQAQLDAAKQTAEVCLKESKPVRVYIDGCFDLIHSGHYNAIRQAKNMSDVLVAGVNSDEDVIQNKGPPILNLKERCEILKHCKFVDEVAPGTAYTPTFELLKELNCGFYAHGDDPCINSDGVDITLKFKEQGMFKVFKRTEGVSTTDITGKLLNLAKKQIQQKEAGPDPILDENSSKKYDEPPKQQFLATSRRIINFANHNMPKASDTIVYISGSFDMLHHGHLRRLEIAKSYGDFLYVGIWDDDMTKYYKGQDFPILSVQERVLMTLACKHVDDIVIGAPLIITKDLITSLNIKKVIHITDTEEDTVLPKFKDIDQLKIARDMGILESVQVADPFYDVTTEKIAQRVYANKEAFELKFAKKQVSLQKYYDESKAFHTEQ